MATLDISDILIGNLISASVTKHDARECEIHALSQSDCRKVEKLIVQAEVNECENFMQGCGPCENFIGGFWCNCVDGFVPDANEQYCADLLECDDDPCDPEGIVCLLIYRKSF